MSTRFALLVYLFIGLIVFMNVLNNGFIGDDEDQIVNNTQVHSINNIPQFFTGSTYFRQETNQSYGLYYRPVMLSLYSIIYQFAGGDPLLYHLTQIILHTVNAVLVYLLFTNFFGPPLSFFSGLIFLVHPINSETVMHIANIQDVLFMFFGLLTFLYLIRSKNSSRQNAGFFIFTSILLLLSFFSKETGLLFIPVIVIFAFLYKNKVLNPFIAISVLTLGIYGLVRHLGAGGLFGSVSISPLANSPLPIRLLNIPKILIKYFSILLWPKDLSTDQVFLITSTNWSDFYLPLLLTIVLILILTFTGIHLFRNKKTQFRKYVLFLSWLMLGLLLHLQIIPLDFTFAQRWFYFPFLGLLGMLSLGVSNLDFEKNQVRKTFIISAIFILSILSVRTFLRSHDWKNSYTLYQTDLRYSPNNFYIQNSLGSLYIRDGDYKKARPLIERSVSIYPYFGNLNNMALILTQENDMSASDEYFKKALSSRRPSYMVYQNYANFLLFIIKDNQRAKTFTQDALQIYPQSSNLWIILAQSEYGLNNRAQALAAAEKAYRINPSKQIKNIIEAIKANKKIP